MQNHSCDMDTNINTDKPLPAYQTHQFIVFAIDLKNSMLNELHLVILRLPTACYTVGLAYKELVGNNFCTPYKRAVS